MFDILLAQVTCTFQADLAYQMVVMSEKLTNDENWALYWTDLDYYNFAVDPSGKLAVIDLENIIVVDRKSVKLGRVF